jgi:hypothetical protein
MNMICFCCLTSLGTFKGIISWWSMSGEEWPTSSILSTLLNLKACITMDWDLSLNHQLTRPKIGSAGKGLTWLSPDVHITLTVKNFSRPWIFLFLMIMTVAIWHIVIHILTQSCWSVDDHGPNQLLLYRDKYQTDNIAYSTSTSRWDTSKLEHARLHRVFDWRLSASKALASTVSCEFHQAKIFFIGIFMYVIIIVPM